MEGISEGSREIDRDTRSAVRAERIQGTGESGATIKAHQRKGRQQGVAGSTPADLAVHEVDIGFSKFGAIVLCVCDQVSYRLRCLNRCRLYLFVGGDHWHGFQ